MEISKTIIGFEDYEISNYGNVRSLKYGKIKEVKKCLRGEYLRVTLGNKNFTVHRLVGLYFSDGYFEGAILNHLDGNKLNNYYKNFEWCTHSKNLKHAWDNGLRNECCLIGNTYKRIKIYALCIKTKEVLEFDSLTIASIETKTVVSTIQRAIKYRQGKTRKYIYSRTEATNEAIIKANETFNLNNK